MTSNTLKWWFALAIITCVVLTGGSAFAQALGLAKVGTVDPANGFPKWYKDTNGLQLAPCLTVAGDPCGLIAGAALPNPAAAVAFPRNFPAEFFYSRATARIQGIGGGTGRADLGMALEGSFAGGVPLAGDQILFARFRLRVTGGLVPSAVY